MRNILIFIIKANEKIQGFFVPKIHVAGLGRWGSTLPEKKKYREWFHDSCSKDNCYLN